MTAKPGDIGDHRPGGDFDTTAKLWDRIVDDITRQGAPCLETVEALVDEACQQVPNQRQSSLEQPDREQD